MSLKEHNNIPSVDALVDYYRQAQLGGEKLRVGIELERSGVYKDGLGAVQFAGENGYHAVYEKLRDEVGWEVIDEQEGVIYEMQRGEARITLEANGRPELSGSANENIHDLSREFRLHDNELREIGNVFNIAWISMGMDPFHTNDVLQLLPKERYQLLAKKGDALQTFMRRLNGLTVNLTYLDEENLMHKAQTAMRILPMISAMYACSPFDAGEIAATLDMRRSTLKAKPQWFPYGVPDNFLDDSCTLADWIAYYLDLPVVYVKDENGVDHTPENLTFRAWMEQGYANRTPTFYDFDQHIKGLWADLRLRPGYLEYRVADSVPAQLAMGLPALTKGLLFDSENWKAVKEMTAEWTLQTIQTIDEKSWTEGLQTDVDGRTLLMYTQELITLANEKLHSFERIDAASEDETLYLAALKEQIYIKEKSPAEEMRDLWEGEWNKNPARILEWCEEHV